MANLNVSVVVGRLTADPEIKHLSSGSTKGLVRVACSSSWTGKDGSERKEVLYLDVEVWDRTAENCANYLKKGSEVAVSGRLVTEEWTDKETGKKRSKIIMKADKVDFIGPKPASSEPSAPARSSGGNSPANRAAAPAEDLVDSNDPDDDDIPF